jgi:hypothetical protein
VSGFVAFCIVAWFIVSALLMYVDVRDAGRHEELLDELWGDEA